MSRGTPHSEETRAAVLGALMLGQSVTSVADKYQLSKATVLAWRRAAGIDASSTPVQPQKREEIGDLVATFLRETLTTVSVQAQHFRDKAWLNKQPAGELAVLHGVEVDKAIRLLQALQDAGDTPEPDQDGGGAASEPGDTEAGD